MPARTYLPTLRLLLHNIATYTTKYQPTIESGLTAPQLTAFLEFLVCLSNLISALGPQEILD